MATKSQRKKQLAKRQKQRKAIERRKKKPTLGGNSRHSERLARQNPRAWSGEASEDVAIFDDAVAKRLPAELAAEVAAVRAALKAASEGRGDAALNGVATIARKSPLSQWRLFIRGLVSWLADDPEAAGQAWRRLDFQRRPGRIAITMMAALRSDLDKLSVDGSSKAPADAAATDWCDRLDKQLLYHAKLLRRTRFDRAALRVAEVGVRVPEESNTLQLGPQKIQWLRGFATEYRPTEPALVAALEQVALRRAFAQEFSDLFEMARKNLRGPKHDPKSLLLSFFYYMQFNDDETCSQRLNEYLERDLPENPDLSPTLRQAIISQIHLAEAKTLLENPAAELNFMPFRWGNEEDAKSIKQHFEAAAKAYPTHRNVYEEHVAWLESKLEDERLKKSEREVLERKLAKVMTSWSRGLPDDVEPSLWLVDYLLENEETEKAKPHVQRLAAVRQDDPRVRATPWKWQLLEAMRLCRRKAWLAEAPEKLEAAASQWPAWLSQAWLPYLHAAWLLRAGKTAEYEQRRRQICHDSGTAPDSLADACMMLGAAQRMRVGAAELKPLRMPVDAAVQNLADLADDDLLRTCGFFWDLHRTRLIYPAYRMHGGKFAREFFSRLAAKPDWVRDHAEDAQLQAAILACSEHRFWSDGYELKLPTWFLEPQLRSQPMFAAAHLNAFLKLPRRWRTSSFPELGTILRQASRQETDPFYRHWFTTLSDQLNELLAKQKARDSGFSFFDQFARRFMAAADLDDDDDEFDDDDALGFDPDCDCPRCRKARLAYEDASA